MTRRRTGVTVGAVYAAVLLSREGSSTRALDVLGGEGLLEPVLSYAVEELPGPRVEDVAGHEDEARGQARLAPFHLPVELRATHHGHAAVADDQVIGLRPELLERNGAVRGGVDRVAVARQRLGQDRGDARLVVDHQDGLSRQPPPPPERA